MATIHQYMKKDGKPVLVDTAYKAQADLNGDVITTTYAKKTELDAKVAEINAKDTAQDASIASISGDLTTLTGKVNTNTQQIAENTQAISAEESSRTAADAELQAGKQDKLVSGTNIKTVNGQTLLGSGNVQIDGGVTDVEVDDESVLQGTVAKISFNSLEKVANKDTEIGSTVADGHYPTTAAVKDFVNSSIASSAANFYGNYSTLDAVPAVFTDFDEKYQELGFPKKSDYMVVSNYSPPDSGEPAASWRFKYRQDSPTAYDKSLWEAEYRIGSAFTTAQQAAIDSGVTSAKVATYDGYATSKQDALTTAQLAAVNSGINSTKVGNYDAHIADKDNPHEVTLSQIVDSTQLAAINSGINATKVATYDGYATTIAGKQDALNDTQMLAVNSGITATKLSSIDQHVGNDFIHLTSEEKNAISGVVFTEVEI